METKRVIFISTLISPFQNELSKYINEHFDIDYNIIYTRRLNNKRGFHWLAENTNRLETSQIPLLKLFKLFNTLKNLNPDLIICGKIRGSVPLSIKLYSFFYNKKFIFWLEGPFPKKNILTKALKYIECKLSFKGAENIISIGDRALNYYSKFCHSVMIPYSQNLHFINEHYCNKFNFSNPINFIFSGQLIDRHNIPVILSAILKLQRDSPNSFSFTFAAKGEKKYLIDDFIKLNSGFRKIIKFDNEYSNWNDRLIPFSHSDVLIYPSNHSGWGLVIPEAMASGVVVVSTNKVEAARYLIEDQVNGVLINENSVELFCVMKRCINDREWLKKLREESLKSYYKSDFKYVAQKLVNHFNMTLQKSN